MTTDTALYIRRFPKLAWLEFRSVATKKGMTAQSALLEAVLEWSAKENRKVK